MGGSKKHPVASGDVAKIMSTLHTINHEHNLGEKLIKPPGYIIESTSTSLSSTTGLTSSPSRRIPSKTVQLSIAESPCT
jgi:hypothetical protein